MLMAREKTRWEKSNIVVGKAIPGCPEPGVIYYYPTGVIKIKIKGLDPCVEININEEKVYARAKRSTTGGNYRLYFEGLRGRDWGETDEFVNGPTILELSFCSHRNVPVYVIPKIEDNVLILDVDKSIFFGPLRNVDTRKVNVVLNDKGRPILLPPATMPDKILADDAAFDRHYEVRRTSKKRRDIRFNGENHHGSGLKIVKTDYRHRYTKNSTGRLCHLRVRHGRLEYVMTDESYVYWNKKGKPYYLIQKKPSRLRTGRQQKLTRVLKQRDGAAKIRRYVCMKKNICIK